MEVTFSLGTDPEQAVTETALAERLAREGAALAEPHTLDGFVNVRNGQPALVIEDDLEALVPNLCFSGVVALAQRGEAEVPMFDHFGFLNLKAEGEQVSVARDGREVGRYPRLELLRGLVGCGRRFLAYLEQLKQLNPYWTEKAEALRQRSERIDDAIVPGTSVPRQRPPEPPAPPQTPPPPLGEDDGPGEG
jgi:hypothetical protein